MQDRKIFPEERGGEMALHRRICFEFRKGDAYEVEIVDYHKG